MVKSFFVLVFLAFLLFVLFAVVVYADVDCSNPMEHVGNVRCSGNVVEVCNCDSFDCSWITSESCLSPQICIGGSCQTPCVPNCGGKICGESNGCGGKCTGCGSGYLCDVVGGVCKKDCDVTACDSSGPLCCNSYSSSDGTVINNQLNSYTPAGCHANCYESYSPFGVHSCDIDSRCYRWYNGDFDCGVKVCFNCVQDKSYCCVQGITASSTNECQECNNNWYLSNGHCCEKGSEWSVIDLRCVPHNPCYYTENCPYAPLSFDWWRDADCINVNLGQACCNMGEMYGVDPWYGFDLITEY